MNDDQVFRLILIVGLVVVLPIGAYFRIKSQATGEKLDRLQEGLFLLVSLRLLGLVGLAGLVAFLTHPDWMAWSAVPLPAWVRWVGVGLGVAAALLLTWTFRNLGKNLTDTVVTRKEHTLVTTGPYRWVRHPFYSSLAVAVLANSLVAANWFFFVTGGLAFVLLLIRTRKEEEKLLERFGDEYRAYMGRTGRFLPRLRAGA
jgi:protein-S-isoprenylcysteine O-methyltransferase Ste14